MRRSTVLLALMITCCRVTTAVQAHVDEAAIHAFRSDLWSSEFLEEGSEDSKQDEGGSADESVARSQRFDKAIEDQVVDYMALDSLESTFDLDQLASETSAAGDALETPTAWELSKAANAPVVSATMPTGPTLMTILVAVNALIVVCGAFFSGGTNSTVGKNSP